jgi:hypothetical protein
MTTRFEQMVNQTRIRVSGEEISGEAFYFHLTPQEFSDWSARYAQGLIPVAKFMQAHEITPTANGEKSRRIWVAQ